MYRFNRIMIYSFNRSHSPKMRIKDACKTSRNFSATFNTHNNQMNH